MKNKPSNSPIPNWTKPKTCDETLRGARTSGDTWRRNEETRVDKWQREAPRGHSDTVSASGGGRTQSHPVSLVPKYLVSPKPSLGEIAADTRSVHPSGTRARSFNCCIVFDSGHHDGHPFCEAAAKLLRVRRTESQTSWQTVAEATDKRVGHQETPSAADAAAAAAATWPATSVGQRSTAGRLTVGSQSAHSRLTVGSQSAHSRLTVVAGMERQQGQVIID